MTPQLFINYKLKSVAHLPWRMLTYKALNTFIDDLFAFVIKMPMMYRIGCLRDGMALGGGGVLGVPPGAYRGWSHFLGVPPAPCGSKLDPVPSLLLLITPLPPISTRLGGPTYAPPPPLTFTPFFLPPPSDVVFFIYLYQRWIYRVDLTRVNEFGISGEDQVSRHPPLPGSPPTMLPVGVPLTPPGEDGPPEAKKKD